VGLESEGVTPMRVGEGVASEGFILVRMEVGLVSEDVQSVVVEVGVEGLKKSTFIFYPQPILTLMRVGVEGVGVHFNLNYNQFILLCTILIDGATYKLNKSNKTIHK